MERRNFLKVSALSGAVAALESCGSPDRQLIRFIPEEELIPGVATWKPSLCTLCPAGCGLLVRVMQGDAEVVRHGQSGLVKMGLAKKLEGNPVHPVNRGKLCARGQAGLQVLYHPDRLRNPLKRKGPRGSGEFEEVSWEDALAEVTSRLSALRSSGAASSLGFLTGSLRGQRRELAERFLKAFGAPPSIVYEPLDESVLRQANLLSFGHAQLPTLDLARADYLISFGADLFGTWNSPVSQAIGYGEMRQGRPGRRGKFVQIEPRMSQTGANADEWIPCRPGMEGALALGIIHVILRDNPAAHSASSRAALLIPGWSQGLPEYAPESIEKRTGVPAATMVRLAHEIAQAEFAAAVMGGAPLAQTNGLFNALAVNALEALVDAGRAPLIGFMPQAPAGNTPAASAVQGGFSAINALAQAILLGRPDAPQVLMVYDSNPVFSAPPGARLREAFAKVPYIVSFGSFLDETTVLADVILPDHAPLESWLEDIPESGANESVASLAPPAVHPLHDTRAMPDVMLDLALRLGGSVAAALPWKSFQDMLRSAFAPLRQHSGSVIAKSEEEFWTKVQEQGGWWSKPSSARAAGSTSGAVASARPPVDVLEPEFDGTAQEFPFFFLPYASPAFRDGSVAHLPWLQEMPDPVTTAMWSSWVELHPKTAERLHIQQGDMVTVTSQHGSLRAPAVIFPGIAPDIIAMPMGQGHEAFGRYASGRGANPFSILAPLRESHTGSLAWAATRVKLARAGSQEGKLIVFAGGMSRFPLENDRR